MKLIDKDALVAEIKRRISIYKRHFKELALYEVWSDAKKIEPKINELENLLSFINNLKTKEDEEPVSKFDTCIQEGDKIVTNDDGTRFNVSQLERVAVSEKKKLRSLSDGKDHLDWLKDAEDVDLEIEVDKCHKNKTFPSVEWSTLDNIAKHFANWQKEQMLKGAFEAIVHNGFAGAYLKETSSYAISNALAFYREGDKVKIIIVKEE